MAALKSFLRPWCTKEYSHCLTRLTTKMFNKAFLKWGWYAGEPPKGMENSWLLRKWQFSQGYGEGGKGHFYRTDSLIDPLCSQGDV